ncbi:MAG: UDP-N-acetylmuramoyl-L-alanyl-D-glutamate--2,6-diaminopimelate ligase [Candidatus Daviesbacteria bacterium]|nr:UDP-N-acetylmuramoyl-L-alanyl-D-glutamate--2,6-diaminopimelate ligase [Candidatus Daviesbacteria bacterium]
MKIHKLMPYSVIKYGKHLPMAVMANTRHGFPARKTKVIGVTGTDGKTTTVNMIYQILKEAGKKVSMISTINAVIGGHEYDTGFHVTSPDPTMVQKFLYQAVKNGDEFMVLEVTSHALDQFRVWGIPFEIGVITNVTHDHLDYHKTFANYVKTKLKLVKSAKMAVINQNIEGSWDNKGKKVVTFGLNKGDFNQNQLKLKLKVPGDYNIENALAALAVVLQLGIDLKSAKESLENFNGIEGRMEEVKNNKGIKIMVDFAHTPNALGNALITLRSQTKGNLIAVFGCASERDMEKRSLMGEISGRLADITILTDEDPRFEDSNKIIEEIAKGVGDKKLFKEPDRKKAIELAINMAKKGDVIGIFGKGHEKSMNYFGVEKPWSDTETVRKILKNE